MSRTLMLGILERHLPSDLGRLNPEKPSHRSEELLHSICLILQKELGIRRSPRAPPVILHRARITLPVKEHRRYQLPSRKTIQFHTPPVLFKRPIWIPFLAKPSSLISSYPSSSTMPAYSVPGMHGDAKSSEAARLRDVIKYLRQDMTSFKKPLERMLHFNWQGSTQERPLLIDHSGWSQITSIPCLH